MNDTLHISPTWIDKKDICVLILVFVLLPIASQAGGLGIAAITALGGGLTLIGLGPSKILSIVRNTPKAFWAVMALLIYGLISSIWSPYQSTRSMPNPMILILGVPLYFLFARAVLIQSKLKSVWLRRVWLWGTIGSALAVLIDLKTGYSISLAIDPVSTGESFEARRGDMIQNLGHGVAVLVLLFPAVAVTLWERGQIGKIVSCALAAAILMSGYFAGMSASMLAMVAVLCIMGLAAINPRIALGALHALAGMFLIGAPLLAFLVTKLTVAQLAALPFSWEERIHNWRYVFGKIREHPIFGHGFDAVRTFTEKHSVRGFDDRAIVSLHPHNAGLHIWVELGALGIALSALILFLSYGYVRRNQMLSTSMTMAICGTGAAAIINASFTFGVWQDWWWAAIVVAFTTVALIPYTAENK